MSPSGAYRYSHGFNLSAVYALIAASLVSFLCVIVPALSWLANFSWFVGVAAGALFYRTLTLQTLRDVSAAPVVTSSQGLTEEA